MSNLSHVIKFQSPFERLKFNSANPQQAVHKSIILQAIIDASNTSNSYRAKKHEVEAKMWLFDETDTDNFCDVCMAADLEPSYVRKIAQDVIELQKIKARKREILIKKNSIKKQNIETTTYFSTKK